MSTWKSNPDLMARLTRAQNHPANVGGDIMSFAGFCSDRDELQHHVEHAERTVYRHVGLAAVAAALAPVRRARRAA